MKSKIGIATILTLLVGGLTSASAQAEKAKQPFWVTEGNINTADYTIIRFYSADRNLMQEERVEGFLIDINKKKNRKYLDRRLNAIGRVLDSANGVSHQKRHGLAREENKSLMFGSKHKTARNLR